MLFIPLVIIVIVGVIVAFSFFVFPNNQPPTDSPADPVTVPVREIESENNTPVAQEVEQQVDAVSVIDVVSPKNTTPVQTNTYSNGTYVADAEYFTPARKKHIISVTLSIRNDVVASVDVQYNGLEAITPNHQRFDGAYEPLILGVEVDDLDLSRVGGASLTTTAFNESLTDIKSNASL